MKKKAQIIYTAVFLALCTAPLAFMPLVKADETAENRELSQMPQLISEGQVNTSWGNEFETFFSEHFAFRNQLVTLDGLMKSDIFHTSSNEKVIVGSDGWLYYAEAVGSYTGEDAMTDRKIWRTAKTLSLMQEHFEGEGRRFLFFSAPNKSSVYPQHMPKRYIKSDLPTNLQRLSSPLDEMGVSYIEIAPLFLESGKTLYQTRDSHWTNEGALLAYNAAADALEMPHDDFSQVEFESRNVWHADLDGMLFPSYERLSDQMVYDYDFTFEYRGNFVDEDDLLIKTKCEGGQSNLLMYRDSFGRAFYPFAAQNANKAFFSRETPYRTSLADEADADYVILEIVERNLGNITAAAPMMYAPVREMDFSATIDESDSNVCIAEDKPKWIKLFGALDEKYFDDDSEILITLENESAIYGFEAFPIYESELLEDEKDSDFGFSLMIDKGSVPSGSYEVYAYVRNGDEYICTNSLREITVE